MTTPPLSEATSSAPTGVTDDAPVAPPTPTAPTSDPTGRPTRWRRPATGLGVTVAGVAVAALVVWAVTGVDPSTTVSTFADGAFGGWTATAATLARAVPLVIVGVGAALALRGGVFNVGGEGQMVVGALGAVIVVSTLGADVPAPVTWALAVVVGTASGAAWAVLPAVLWSRRGVSEILSTLLLNFITASLLLWVLELSFFADPDPLVITPQGEPIPARAELPILEAGSRLHLGIVVALALVAAAWWTLRTPHGIRLDLVGANPNLAAQAGLHPTGARVALLLASAGAAGLAGTIQLLGVSHRVTPGLSGGIGYTGLLVAVLGRSRPIATAGAAVAFAALLTGGDALEFEGVPRSVVVVVQAVGVVAVAAAGRSRR